MTTPQLDDPLFSEDSIFHGELRLRQHRAGYRFTEDAILLAAFAARGGPAEVAADCGAGCGVVALMLLHLGLAQRALAVEIQPGLAQLVRHNATVNRLASRLAVLQADLGRLPLAPASLDLLVSNPPHLPAGSGQLPPNRERAVARHELLCTPHTLAGEAARCLSAAGRVAVVYPFGRLTDVRDAIEEAGLHVQRLQLVHPGPDAEPVLFLLEAARVAPTGGQVLEEPSLTTRDADGGRAAVMEDLAAGRWGLSGRG